MASWAHESGSELNINLIRLDYNLDISVAFMIAALVQIMASKSLSVLRHVLGSNSKLRLPSWIPFLNCRLPKGPA